MKRGLLLLALTLIMASGFSASGAVEHSPELWHVTHVTDPTSGKFNYCAIESSFDNGLYLAFARNRDFNTNIVVSFPDKRLQDHAKYQMNVAIDSNPPREMMGFAADPTILVIPLQHDRVVLGWLQKGKLLDLKGPQDSVKFALDGANDAFRKLQQCVEKSLKDETVQGTTPSHVTPESADVAHVTANDTVEPLPLPAGSSGEEIASAAPMPAAPMPAAPMPAAPVPAAPVPASEPAPAKSQPTPAPADESAVVVELPPSPQVAPEKTSQPAPAPLPAREQKVAAVAPVEVAAAETATPPALPPVQVVEADKPPEPASTPPTTAPVSVQAVPPPVQPAAAPSTDRAEIIPAPVPVAPSPVTPTPTASAPAAAEAEQTPPQPAKLSLPELLAASALKPTGKCTEKSSTCTWSSDQVLGSAMVTKTKDSFLDTMMDDSDRREKQCKGQFSASIGAPMRRNSVTVAEASYTCTGQKGPVTDVTLYLDSGDKVLAVAASAPGTGGGKSIQVRDRIEAALPLATNYK